MELRKAVETERSLIFELYRSVIHLPYCPWDQEYPGIENIEEDLSTGNLYAALENGHVIGAVSVVHENELDSLTFWQYQSAVEIARVVISPALQGKGFARAMLSQLFSELKDTGVSAVHLLAADTNLPAQKLYHNCGFEYRGECDMFGQHFYALEKIL